MTMSLVLFLPDSQTDHEHVHHSYMLLQYSEDFAEDYWVNFKESIFFTDNGLLYRGVHVFCVYFSVLYFSSGHFSSAYFSSASACDIVNKMPLDILDVCVCVYVCV